MPYKLLLFTMNLGIGGAEKMVREFAEGVNRESFSPEILTFDRRVFVIPGVPIHRRKKNLLDVAEFFHTNHYDIIHSHCFWPNILAAIFKRDARLIWHEHDTSNGLNIFQLGLRKALVGKADAVLCVSHAVASEIPGDKSKIHVLYNGI
jgi:hypothetical protein